MKNQRRFLLPASAALASCGHLRLCKLPWMQVCFLGLRAFSTLCQSVDFVNILKARVYARALQICYSTFHRGSLASSGKDHFHIGRSNLVWSSEWISLRVKTSTSVLSMYPQNGRGKRRVLIQLLDGTTVSPPDSFFASGFFPP